MPRKRTPSHKIRRIPVYLTPSQPVRGEFTRYTTLAPLDLWPSDMLQCTARHSFCPDHAAAAAAELAARGETVRS